MSQSPRETLQQEFEHLLKAEKACFDGIRNWSHGPAPKELNGLPELRQQFDPKLLRLQEHFVGKQTLLTYVNELRSLLIPVRNAVLFADKSFRDYVADPFNSRGFHSKLRAHLGWKLRDGLRPLNQDLLDTHQQSLERAMEQCRALMCRLCACLNDECRPLPLLEVEDGDPDAQKDGPVRYDGFRWKGQVYQGLRNKAWMLVAYLWKTRTRQADDDQLVPAVWDNVQDVSKDSAGSVRREVNEFFKDNGLPFSISVSNHPELEGRILVKLLDRPPSDRTKKASKKPAKSPRNPRR